MSIELRPDENDALAMALTVTTLRLPARRLILRKGCRAREIFLMTARGQGSVAPLGLSRGSAVSPLST
jgi:hypothetical protein